MLKCTRADLLSTEMLRLGLTEAATAQKNKGRDTFHSTEYLCPGAELPTS